MTRELAEKASEFLKENKVDLGSIVTTDDKEYSMVIGAVETRDESCWVVNLVRVVKVLFPIVKFKLMDYDYYLYNNKEMIISVPIDKFLTVKIVGK